MPCTILAALETLSYLILIITPGISSVIISTFWRRKLKHRKLPKVIQQCDFGARVLNYALLRCQSVATLWRELEEGEVKYNQEAEGTISMNLKVQIRWGLCACVTSTS